MLFNALDNLRKLIHQVIGAEAVNMYLVEGIHAGPCARQTNQSDAQNRDSRAGRDGDQGRQEKEPDSKGHLVFRTCFHGFFQFETHFSSFPELLSICIFS